MNNKFKIGGLVSNQQRPSTSLSKELLQDIKSLGLDYIICGYIEDIEGREVFDNFLETLSNADEVGIEVIVIPRVFIKNKKDPTVINNLPRPYWWYPENLSLSKLEEACQHPSFIGLYMDEPADTDEMYKNVEGFYNICKDYNIKLDVNLFPNYTFVFNGNENMWNTHSSFKEYVEKFSQINDTIGVDFYPITYVNEKYILQRPRTWLECLNTLLELSYKYPEKDFKIYIQVTEHDGYGKLTTEVLSMQSYVSLIGGVKNIRYFGLTDCDVIPRFKNSPITSENNGYKHGSTYNVVKEFNNGKFKDVKDFITSKNIDKIDLYDNNKSQYNYIPDISIYNTHSDGKMIISVDKNLEYIFIVNPSFESKLVLTTDLQEVVFEKGKQKLIKNKNISINCGDICILATNKNQNIFQRIWNRIINFFKKLGKLF